MPIVKEFEDELNRRSPPNFGRWFSIDLHNHSPTSRDYVGDRPTAVAKSIDAIRDRDLSVVMFTDHERLPDEKFIQEVGQGSGKLVLRGVELNVFVDAWQKPEGKVDKNLFFHVLIGFDPTAKNDANFWLQEIYRKCGDENRDCGGTKVRGITAPISFLLETLKESNAIVIPAHLHSTRDAFRSRSVDDIYTDPEFIKCARDFTALEVTSLETAKFFDGSRAETGNLRKTCIRSSDAHEANRLGARVTFAQMESPSFQELKAALDLPFRISLGPVYKVAVRKHLRMAAI